MTEDTGGHIAYVLGAACAQARRADVRQVDIVTRAFDVPALGASQALAEEAVMPKCTIRRIRTARTGYLAKEALEAEIPALTAAFLQMLRDGARPDIIHAHFADAAQLAEAARRAFGIPWVYTSHSLALDKHRGAAGGDAAGRVARERRAIRRAAAIVASSRDEAERQIVAYDPDAEGRVHCIAPGVTTPVGAGTEQARERVAPFLRDTGKPIILAIARPIPKKNLVTLVRAYAADPWLREHANLVILAGLRDGLTGCDDEQQATIRALFDAVDRNDLWGRVALPRQHSQSDVASFYALAAEGGVFVNPAQHEPFGLTLIEAARAGVPVVATKNGGPVDIVRCLGAGELVDPSDPADIARGLRAALTDPTRAVRTAEATRRARTGYDWDLWAARVQSVYAGIAETHPVTRPHRVDSLLASDLDGTLTGDREAAERFCDWHARARNVAFVIATGRALPDARRVMADWSLPRPDLFIASVGTEIWRPDASGALRLCRDYADTISGDWDRDGILDTLAPLGLALQPIYEQRRWKLSFFGDAATAAQIEAALDSARLPARVVHSHDRLIDVVPRHSGKAAAVRFAARLLGLGPEDCVVAGDSGNDRDMLEGFGRAIVPANAASELGDLRGAYRPALPHADGVLDGLARFGLDPARPSLIAAE
ncbi:HAD-IIB family hydrolase [Rhodobacterales bacterium HKCCE2091]|nr:HAD-IIB family hydrolase [Rhodobacterales bacterium HKCCE2091]